MADTFVSSGDRVEIFLKSTKNSKKSYVSKVVELKEDGLIIVESPISQGRVVLVPQDYHYSLYFTTKNGIISCAASVVEHYREEGMHYTVFKPEHSFEKKQRRSFYRFECAMPFKFALIKDSNDAVSNASLLDGIIRDLGGGGIRFISNTFIDISSMIHCIIVIDNDILMVNGIVLRGDRLERATSAYKYDYRVMFIDITKEDQEKIIRYIFIAQRKQIVKIETSK